MEISYCPGCGTDLKTWLGDEADELEAAEDVIDANVEIARIEAKRDIELARISAGMYKDEIVIEAAVAEAESEILQDVVEQITEPDAPEISSEPVAVVTIDDSTDQTEDTTTDLPEPEHHDSEPREPKPYGSGSFFG